MNSSDCDNEELFFRLGLEIVNPAKTKTLRHRRRVFVSHFQASPKVCSILWSRCYLSLQKYNPLKKHLLWCLLFMKVYSSEMVLANKVGTDEKTFRKRVWIFINEIYILKPSVVSAGLMNKNRYIYLLTLFVFKPICTIDTL